MRFGRSTWIILSGLWLAGTGWSTPTQAQERWRYSSDGSEVSDLRTGLTWRRCSEGQSWTGGNCVASAIGLTHEQALALAKTQAGWRLPNIKELASIVDLRQSNPAIDGVVFPSTPADFFWSSTPVTGPGGYARGIYFSAGEVYPYLRINSSRVRLVR